METAHRRACCFEEAFIERFVNDSARRVTMMVSTLRITDQPPRATRNNCLFAGVCVLNVVNEEHFAAAIKYPQCLVRALWRPKARVLRDNAHSLSTLVGGAGVSGIQGQASRLNDGECCQEKCTRPKKGGWHVQLARALLVAAITSSGVAY
jgi:hypothetical protein